MSSLSDVTAAVTTQTCLCSKCSVCLHFALCFFIPVTTDEKPSLTVEVVCVFAQREVSSDVDTSSSNIQFPASVTDSHIKSPAVQKTFDLTR